MSRRKLFLFNIIGIILFVFILEIGINLVLLVADTSRAQLVENYREQRDQCLLVSEKRARFVPHPYLSYVTHPYYSENADAWGISTFIPPATDEEDMFTTLAVGGSMTASTYPQHLQTYLQEQYPELG